MCIIEIVLQNSVAKWVADDNSVRDKLVSFDAMFIIESYCDTICHQVLVAKYTYHSRLNGCTFRTKCLRYLNFWIWIFLCFPTRDVVGVNFSFWRYGSFSLKNVQPSLLMWHNSTSSKSVVHKLRASVNSWWWGVFVEAAGVVRTTPRSPHLTRCVSRQHSKVAGHRSWDACRCPPPGSRWCRWRGRYLQGWRPRRSGITKGSKCQLQPKSGFSYFHRF